MCTILPVCSLKLFSKCPEEIFEWICSGKKMFFCQFFTLGGELVYFQPKNFGMVAKTAFCMPERKISRTKSFWKKLIFPIKFGLWANQYWTFGKKTFEGSSKLKSASPAERFEENHYMRKKQLLNLFRSSSKKCTRCAKFLAGLWKLQSALPEERFEQLLCEKYISTSLHQFDRRTVSVST